MEKKRFKTSSLIFAGVLLIAIITSLTPQGRELLTSMSNKIGASAATSSRYEIAVILNTENGGSYEWRAPITRREYKEAEMTKRKMVKKYATEAKKALARKMGYFNNLYGDDNDKMTNTQLAKMVVTDLRADRETEIMVR